MRGSATNGLILFLVLLGAGLAWGARATPYLDPVEADVDARLAAMPPTPDKVQKKQKKALDTTKKALVKETTTFEKDLQTASKCTKTLEKGFPGDVEMTALLTDLAETLDGAVQGKIDHLRAALEVAADAKAEKALARVEAAQAILEASRASATAGGRVKGVIKAHKKSGAGDKYFGPSKRCSGLNPPLGAEYLRATLDTRTWGRIPFVANSIGVKRYSDRVRVGCSYCGRTSSDDHHLAFMLPFDLKPGVLKVAPEEEGGAVESTYWGPSGGPIVVVRGEMNLMAFAPQGGGLHAEFSLLAGALPILDGEVFLVSLDER